MRVLEKIKSLLSDAFPRPSEEVVPEYAPDVPYEFSQTNKDNPYVNPEGTLKLEPDLEYDMLDISETDVSKRYWPEGATLLKLGTDVRCDNVFVVDEKPDVVADRLDRNQPVHAIIPPKGGLVMLPEETHDFILSPVKSESQQDISLG